jgi:GNAT superfamily N-acetyltransferase
LGASPALRYVSAGMEAERSPRRVVTTHLELTEPAQLVPARPSRTPYTVQRVGRPSSEFSRFLFRAVGGDWYWLSRIDWTLDRWRAWVERPEVQTWVAYVDGSPAGYVELETQTGGDVEIRYFGLLPAFVGLGMGGALLTDVVRRAWAIDGTRRVWLHTCDLDHPRALANYQARGFRIFKVEEGIEHLPAKSPGPWRGA